MVLVFAFESEKRKDGGGGLIGDRSVIDRWTECIFLKVSV